MLVIINKMISCQRYENKALSKSQSGTLITHFLSLSTFLLRGRDLLSCQTIDYTSLINTQTSLFIPPFKLILNLRSRSISQSSLCLQRFKPTPLLREWALGPAQVGAPQPLVTPTWQ